MIQQTEAIRYVEASGLTVGTVRVGVCCPNMALKIWCSRFQTYVECMACECRCITPGKEDGQTTCWVHHDCSDGSCTHGE